MEKYTLRKLHAELNILTKSDGSVLLSQGNTAVIVSVNGPIEAKQQKVSIDNLILEMTYKTYFGLPDISHKMNEVVIGNTCETCILTALHPRTAVNISLQEMQNDGSLLACSINACCLALMNAGVPLKFVFAATSCIINNQTDEIILDPTKTQEEIINEENKSILTFVFDSIDKNVITSYTIGNFSDSQYLKAMLKCRDASNVVFQFYRDIVKTYANKLNKRNL